MTGTWSYETRDMGLLLGGICTHRHFRHKPLLGSNMQIALPRVAGLPVEGSQVRGFRQGRRFGGPEKGDTLGNQNFGNLAVRVSSEICRFRRP